MNITTLIFDLGNVVLTNDWHDNNQKKFDEFNIYFKTTFNDTERAWKIFWPLYETGKITETDFWQGFLHEAHAWKIDVNYAKKLWRKYQYPIKGMLDYLSDLKKRYSLAVLSNTGKEWLEYKVNKFDLKTIFKIIVSSAGTGLKKPDLQIYKTLISRLKVKPQECVFIDDTEKTLPPARELGIKTVQFKDRRQLEKDLAKLGVKL